MSDGGKGDFVESKGLSHGKPHRFLISPCRNSKGRELRTAVRRRAYSPEGYSISPLPTLNSRNIHHIPRFFYLDRQKKPLFRDWQPLTEEFLGSVRRERHKTRGMSRIKICNLHYSRKSSILQYLNYVSC